MQPSRQIKLANGLTVSINDRSRRYFGDYHQIKVDITCQVPILAEYFNNHDEWENALRLVGRYAQYSRTIEQMGVPTADLPATLDAIIENFCQHALQYLASPDFPRKVIQSELTKRNSSATRSYQG